LYGTSRESIVQSLIRAARRSAFLELVLEVVVGLALEVPHVLLEIVHLPGKPFDGSREILDDDTDLLDDVIATLEARECAACLRFDSGDCH
jgi:hypothetical protein